MRNKPRDTAAVVVTYHPAESALRNLRSLAEQLSTVFIIDNTPGSGRNLRYFIEAGRMPGVHVVRLGENTGIGAALNIGIKLAKQHGYRWVFTFDQDSFLPRGSARKMRYLIGNSRVALLAPMYRDAFKQTPFLAKSDEWLPHRREAVITSGNLVRIAAWQSVGGFDWRLFIDMVDFDFCFRLAEQGWLVTRTDKVHLLHRLGNLRTVRLFNLFPRRVRTYSPFRRYFQARNSMIILRRHAQFARAWSVEHALRLLLVWVKLVLAERTSINDWINGIRAGLLVHGYQVDTGLPGRDIADFCHKERPRFFSARRLARTYRKRLEELSTFP